MLLFLRPFLKQLDQEQTREMEIEANIQGTYNCVNLGIILFHILFFSSILFHVLFFSSFSLLLIGIFI